MEQRFRTLIEGAIAIWQADVTLVFEADRPVCRIRATDGDLAAISMEIAAFGPVWRLSAVGRRDRVHASVVPALRGLREILCPDRAAGRVLFVSGTEHD